MTGNSECRQAAVGLIVLLGLAAGPLTARASDPVLSCEKAAGKSLVSCIGAVAKLQGKCFDDGGAACGAGDAKIAKALAHVAKTVAKKCLSDAAVQSAGYGPTVTVGGLTARIQAACNAESASLAARTFGGPHGAALAAADPTARECLMALHREGRRLLAARVKRQNACVDKQRKHANCDAAKTAEKLAGLDAKAGVSIALACGVPDPLPGLIAVDAAEYIARADAQSRCASAMAHPETTPLSLDCGPRDDLVATPRGTFVQVVLDPVATGTRCGDGSPYAFWVRLPPAGQPPENVLLQMQGGGVCLAEADCAATSADLFEALTDPPSQTGIMSNDPLVSSFANWTKVYLPYCTQDLFAGGGATSSFPSITVQRYGARNVRAALRYVRDVLWRELDATTPEGYTPERVRMLFGGTSAGGFGTLYNYHYVLDDLQWTHTTAWPDASLALDNGGVGIGTVGSIMLSTTPPYGWSSQAYLPPYCFASNCGLGPVIYAASAPRLKAEPEQQFLVLSNQVDGTQRSTTFFANMPAFINTLRQSYCDTAGTVGLHYFLPAITASTHVIATRQNLYTGYAVDGVLMRDWLAQAMTSPDAVVDAVEGGTLVTDFPGVLPFPCAID
ncbi:MAG: pectin acetylesterase-family hydrolase [bacterium]